MYKVLIKEIGTDKLVHTILCGTSKRKAEKTWRGVTIKMDVERFYTEIVGPEDG